MTAVFARCQQAHNDAEIAAAWFFLAVLLGILLVCATSRSAAEG